MIVGGAAGGVTEGGVTERGLSGGGLPGGACTGGDTGLVWGVAAGVGDTGEGATGEGANGELEAEVLAGGAGVLAATGAAGGVLPPQPASMPTQKTPTIAARYCRRIVLALRPIHK